MNSEVALYVRMALRKAMGNSVTVDSLRRLMGRVKNYFQKLSREETLQAFSKFM